MADRLALHTLLETLLGSDSVYFQPPSTFQMRYPCIVYERNYLKTEFADNKPYSIGKRYSVTLIYKDPDSIVPDRIAKLENCIFDRHFVADNLNHDVFSLYF